VTVDEGMWAGSTPMTFAYQWSRCDASAANCVDIPGATQKAYTLVGADVGSKVRARVDASNAAGSSDYAARVVASGPLSYWRFADSNGTAADERGFANGSYVGAPSLVAPGLLDRDANQAESLDGASQYVNVTSNGAWTASPFSIELLVKPSVLPLNRTIWSTIGSAFTGWWLNTSSNGVPRMFIGDGSAWRSDASAPALEAGMTYHIVATYDGSRARLYLNGVLVSTGPAVTMAPDVGPNVMRFGAYSTGPGQYWPGVLDDASFYPTVLSPGEVTAHYEASEHGSSVLSDASPVVGGAAQAPVNSVLPVVSGLAQVGSVLSVSDGSWSGSAPLSFAYRWQRCAGGSCVDVGGAVGSSYAVVAADVGSSLRVGVRASNGVGSSEVFSGETAVVVAAPVSPSFVGSATQGVGSSSFVVPRPAGVVAGDVLIGWVATDTTHVVGAAPAGWVQLGSTQDDGSDSSVSVFWRVVQSGDPASWSGSFTSSESGVVGVVAYRGVDQGAPVDVVGQGRSGSGVVSSTPSVTPAGPGRVVLAVFGGDPGSGSRSGSADTDPVAVERVDAVLGTQGFVYAEDLTQAAASPVSLDVTWNASDSTARFILALRSPSG
jgi:hypothetical protein